MKERFLVIFRRRIYKETVSCSINFVQTKENNAASIIAAGVTRRAFLNPHISDSHPSTVGEIASPSAWIKKMFTAKAIARMDGLVMLTIMVFNGPVFRNRKNSAKKIAAIQL